MRTTDRYEVRTVDSSAKQRLRRGNMVGKGNCEAKSVDFGVWFPGFKFRLCHR